MYFSLKNIYYYCMSDNIKAVRGRVVFFLVMFALIITFLALLFSFNMIYSFQRRIAVRSAEFNLRLVAGLVEQDLRDLTALAYWCGHSELIAGYFLSEGETTLRSMEAWRRLSEEYINNRSGPYVRRLIVFDASLKKFLQVGNMTLTSDPVTVYNLGRIFDTGLEWHSRTMTWQPLVADPYVLRSDSLVIPFLYPVYNPNDGGEIGTVFLTANISLITDKFRNYSLPENSGLYLSIGAKSYLIENERVSGGEFPYTITGRGSGETAGSAASILEARDAEGRRRTLVSYPLRDEITLSQVLSPTFYFPFSGALPTLGAGFGILIIILIIMAFGVNRMTNQISLLLDRRLEDEKNKRDLEYRMLQSQINPHFLYNTLNSIKWMATIQNASGIAEMTTALSRLLQIISRDSRKMVPLRDELAILDDYLVIQKYRYGDSVVMETKISSEALLDTPVPRFVLQPLIENAIFHGIEPKGAGVITVEVKPRDNDVVVSVTDNGVGMSPETIATFRKSPREIQGIFRDLGMHNVDERLRCAFGEKYGLSVASEEGKFTTITITLPAEPGDVSQNG